MDKRKLFILLTIVIVVGISVLFFGVQDPKNFLLNKKLCVYSDSFAKITFEVDEGVECTSNDKSHIDNLQIESENFDLSIGFLFEAGCQEPEFPSECREEVVYESKKVKVSRIFNRGQNGDEYVNTRGIFFSKDGSVLESIGINFLRPYLSSPDINLSNIQKEELEKLLDTVEIEEVDSSE